MALPTILCLGHAKFNHCFTGTTTPLVHTRAFILILLVTFVPLNVYLKIQFLKNIRVICASSLRLVAFDRFRLKT